jgi:SAM-dependent methyltransferase
MLSKIRLVLGTLRHVLETHHMLEERVAALERRFPEHQWDASRTRWRAVEPTIGLTWDKQLSGTEFIRKASAHGAFAAERSILEVGPGYGRLPKSLLEAKAPFREYTGVDLSPNNVAHLKKTFTDPRMRFVNGDAETLLLERPFDLLISSLTLKHLYPTFQKALANLFAQAAPGARAVFDLIEVAPGTHFANFEKDGKTYVRHYSREELPGVLAGSGLELEAFDTVQHDTGWTRLLVVARRKAR